jgi:cobalamin-dependent methionine synthase I
MIVIGELINATRKKIKEAMESGDADYIRDLALRQDRAGADFIDVNAGSFPKEEKELHCLEWAISLVQEVSRKPLSIDSSRSSAIKHGFALNKNGKPLLNSISMEKKKWDELLPLVCEHDCFVLGLCMDDKGIPAGADSRFRIAESIIKGLLEAGKAIEDIWIDPLTTPVSAAQENGLVVLETIKLLKSAYPEVKIITGVSNVSFGLPARKQVNRASLILNMAMGLDGALIDPLDTTLMSMSKAAEVVLNRDPFSRNYLTAFREGLIPRD